MSLQEPNRNQYSFVNLPDYKSTTQFLERKIITLIDNSSMVLDAGSGRWNRMLKSRKAKKIIGVDIEFDSIKSNKIINFGVVGDIQQQMFQEEVFDLIVSNDLVEHLQYPEQFIKVCSRVLKPFGHIVIAAPNRNSLFGILAAIIPNDVKQWLFKIIFGRRNQNEVHFYRLNTEDAFRKILTKNGFSHIDITFINKLGSQATGRIFWGWYYQLCRTIPFMRKASPGLLCIAQKIA